MSTHKDPSRERPSTYFVQDRSNQEELNRLQLQDQLVTAAMGGVLPEQPDPMSFGRVLDVGCGTGDWLIEAATTYPSISALVGVDVSDKMLAYARRQAEAQQVSDRVQFRVMDALRRLDFPDDSFDLVNLRFGMSYLRTWDWPSLLQEMGRVSQAGGVIRVTESEMIFESSSSALLQLTHLLFEAFCQAGHFFTPTGDGVTSQLARLLQQSGLKPVQTRAHAVEYRSGTASGQHFAEDMKHVFRTVVPYIRKWTSVPADYETIYQQALAELQQPDCVTTWRLLTAWGSSPRKKEQTMPMEG
jgi:ubiquinone/menaquinone biosynthesis C-methylase UbiE